MSLFIRCQWLPPPEASLESRFSEVGKVTTTLRALSSLGPRWFKLGNSRKDALKREVPLGEIHTNRKLWRRRPLGDGEAYWDLSVWSGRSEEEGANFGISLHERSSQADGIGFATEREFLRRTVAWVEVIDAARRLSVELGGCAVVSSNELMEEASSQGIAHADHAAYAAFWGVDRSGRNPLYRWLAKTLHATPFEIVACESWEDASGVDGRRFRAIAQTLAAVAAEAGEGTRA
jgi:hypothetical protein